VCDAQEPLASTPVLGNGRHTLFTVDRDKQTGSRSCDGRFRSLKCLIPTSFFPEAGSHNGLLIMVTASRGKMSNHLSALIMTGAQPDSHALIGWLLVFSHLARRILHPLMFLALWGKMRQHVKAYVIGPYAF